MDCLKRLMMFKCIKDYAKEWSLFEKCWLLTFTPVNVYLFFAWNDTLVGLIASLTGMMCVVLVAKGKISNYYFGIVKLRGGYVKFVLLSARTVCGTVLLEEKRKQRKDKR